MNLSIAFVSLIIIQIQLFLPIKTANRHNVSNIKLTTIGDFGLERKPRPTVPAHLHTGIDIKRLGNNYYNEPIYAVAKGKVISIRSDGPFAQIIIEHKSERLLFWSVYEHVAGIDVKLNELVIPTKPIARFMNTTELNSYGWQFDHFHLEIMKVRPLPLNPNSKTPERLFNTYGLVCYTENDLNQYYYNPLEFLINH